MADQDQSSQAATLTVPPETQERFPDLIALIKGSESMNDEERQYWVNILPIMTTEQITNLREILDNEKKQLAAIDEKYRAEAASSTVGTVISDDERRKRREQRQTQEATHQREEDKQAEDILKAIEGPTAQ